MLGVIFDGSFEGFLTIIYKYYYEKLRPCEIVSEQSFQQTLSTEYFKIDTDNAQATKTLNGLREKLSTEIYERVYLAFVNDETDRYIHIFNYLILCFKHGAAADGFTQVESVIKTHRYAKNSGHELQLLSGFTRFSETSDGILYADISPKNDVMPMLADFFSDRLRGERWVIHDVKRGKAAVFNSSEWIITDAPEVTAKIISSAKEKDFQNLWTVFYNTIAIKERTNPKLHRQMKPKRFWKHMTEHQLN